MKFKHFLEFVEIRTKLASLIPYIFGSLYAYFHYRTFNWQNALLMFGSLLSFDMACTAINNFMAYKNEKAGENVIRREGINPKIGLSIIFSLLLLAVILGGLLTWKTDLVVLALGVLSFGVGIFYSYGPIPLYRMPVGELLSGFFMGFIIPFLSIYIHVPEILTLTFSRETVEITAFWGDLLTIFLVSIPLFFTISNLMLSNNICDLEEDRANHRYTLVHYLGLERSLQLFIGLYITLFLSVVAGIGLALLPWVSILLLFLAFPTLKSAKLLLKTQEKEVGVQVAVKNMVIIGGGSILCLVVGIFV